MKHSLTFENYKKAISYDELIKSANECARGVLWKESTAKFMYDKYSRVAQLRKILLDNSSIIGSYKIQSYIKFKTYDPKPREISATRIRDRVLQRSLCNNGLYDAFVKPFIYDNLACQKKKGVTRAIQRVHYHLRDYYEEYKTNKGFYLKLDIRHYFERTPHKQLKNIVKYYIREPHFQAHVFKIIDSFEDKRSQVEIDSDPYGKRGIGLGSQLSQLLQLLYLNDLDHYIKEQLHVKHYLRYMDDMLLFVNTRDEAKTIWNKIEQFVINKGLELNQKSRMGRLEDNIIFCKIKYKLSRSGKIHTKVVRKTFNKEIRRLNTLKYLYSRARISRKDFIQHGNTWYGFAKWRCSGGQIKFIKKHIKKLFSE